MEGTDAVICVAVTVPTVVSVVLPHRTTDPVTKFVPVTTRLNAALPVGVELGLNEVIVGPVTVNVAVANDPPGFVTVTVAVPAVVNKVDGTVAWICPAVWEVIVRGTALAL